MTVAAEPMGGIQEGGRGGVTGDLGALGVDGTGELVIVPAVDLVDEDLPRIGQEASSRRPGLRKLETALPACVVSSYGTVWY